MVGQRVAVGVAEPARRRRHVLVGPRRGRRDRHGAIHRRAVGPGAVADLHALERRRPRPVELVSRARYWMKRAAGLAIAPPAPTACHADQVAPGVAVAPERVSIGDAACRSAASRPRVSVVPGPGAGAAVEHARRERAGGPVAAHAQPVDLHAGAEEAEVADHRAQRPVERLAVIVRRDVDRRRRRTRPSWASTRSGSGAAVPSVTPGSGVSVSGSPPDRRRWTRRAGTGRRRCRCEGGERVVGSGRCRSRRPGRSRAGTSAENSITRGGS